MNAIAIIPARAGSTGIPGKNTKFFLGQPLIEWTIASAIESNCFQDIIVTTDCDLVKSLSMSFPVKILFPRPPHLCTSSAETVFVAQHALNWLKTEFTNIDIIFILEPTSPGRQAVHIQKSLEILNDNDVDTVASISEVPHHYSVSKQLKKDHDGNLIGIKGLHIGEMVHRRQNIEKSYALDGVIFGCRSSLLIGDSPTLWGKNIKGIQIDPEFIVDLDEPHQWDLAERQLAPILVK